MRVPDVDLVKQKLRQKYTSGCGECRGSGFIHTFADDDDLVGSNVECACSRKVHVDLGLRIGNIPPEFWGVESFHFEYNTDALEVIRAYDPVEGRQRGKGFTMFGENGAGKTSMACLLLLEALKLGYSAGYLTVNQYLSCLAERWERRELFEHIDRLSQADFLVLDELGKERKPDLASIDTLLRARRGEMRPTILITNMSVKAFRESYGASIMSILSDRNTSLVFEPGDYRRVLRSK